MAIPEGFVEFGGHYYKYVKTLATHSEARSAAAAAGGYLATITSAAENAFLADLIVGQDLGAWLGGSDAGTEGVWTWTDGPEAGTTFWNQDSGAPDGQYSNWAEGEPTGVYHGLEEDVLHMMANSDQWNDAADYWMTMGYFIEIDGDGDGDEPPSNHLPIITSNGGGAAAAIAVAENGHAVTTVTASDTDGDTFVFSIAGADATRFSINPHSGALAFVSPPDFESPADADGNNIYSVEVRVDDAHGGIATQALTVTVTDLDETPDPTTPPGFAAFDGHLYRYVKGLYTFAEAQAGAAALGGHLATITSAAENAFLAGLIAGEDLGAWLGGSDASEDNVWRWVEGQEAGTMFWNGDGGGSAPSGQYANWNPGEPNGIWNGIEEDHLHMMANSDLWNDASGHWSTMGYFVEVDGWVAPPPPANTPPTITSNGGGDAAAIAVAENSSAVTTVAASDTDGDTPVYAIAGGADAALFTIDATSGALSFVAAPDFELPDDADSDNVYGVVVRADDGHGGLDSQSLAVTVTDETETEEPTPPPGYQAYNGHFYKFVNASVTHAEAEAAAAAEGGYLATITSAQENALLAEAMAAANAWGFGGWLGGSDAASEGVWRWTEGPETGDVFWNGLADGSAPEGAYTNWLPGEPSQYQGTEEDYLHMLAGTDLWNDIPDSYYITMGYFIEIG
ncbi:MAG: hypothetical protein KDK07_15490 [Bauldia sp.]|nr:hypothetical protein [Bauldia sp.]